MLDLESLILIGALLVSVVGVFCSTSLLLTTNYKKSALPSFAVMAYIMFMIVYLYIGCMAFLNLCIGKLFLMEILASTCLIASIGISYKMKKDGKGDKLKKITQIPFWCCVLLLRVMVQIEF